MTGIFTALFNFCASIKLAVINLIVFAALLSYATFYESSFTTELVQKHIYKTLWFDLLMFFIGLNVACAALSRFPWKKKHTGFVITHLGILIILFGSMITRKFGIEGQIILEEGNRQDYISIPNEMVFTVALPEFGVKHEFDPWFVDKRIPEGKEVSYPVGDTGINCFVERYVFDPRMKEVITNDNPMPNAAVQIAVSAPNAPQPFQDWLIASAPMRNAMDLSIAKVEFKGNSTLEAIQNRVSQKNTPPAKVTGNGSVSFNTTSGELAAVVMIDDIQNQPATFEYEGDSYTVNLEELIPNAYIVDNDLKNVPDKPLNPAVKFTISGPKGNEEHLPFALFPELGSFHGKQESLYDFSVAFDYPMEGGNKANNTNLVEIFVLPDNSLYYIGQNDMGSVVDGPISVGQPFDTSWRGVSMQVNQFYQNAQVNQEIEDAGSVDGTPHNNPIVKIRIENQGQSQSDFVSFNRPKTFTVGGKTCVVEFGQRHVPVGFELQLIDFRAPRYPGTNKPSRFESDVIMRDPTKDIEREQMVYMNNPLYHNGYAVYQASYIEGQNGQPDISIFSVAKAPGTIIIYIGSIVMVLGMIIFYMSRKLYFPDKKELDF